MASSSITVCICDRCGTRGEFRDARESWEWGHMRYAQINGPRHAFNRCGKTITDKDICPSCLSELHSWWERKNTDG